ncbi:phage minor structural protein, N-terminal region [Paenibacillus polymyxa]|uniref:phage tail spike protein n=1 Tax=Paenibacillus polymyxa TaxID=1406 RepID=UPI000D967F7E|nr:phage tail spike protein [Paenibacillus polymyxa]SPY16902.1 phage minor structural protein, N-terminal region [Paenibacillus polymyxa]
MRTHVTVYDLQMRRVAFLENAFDIGYDASMNALWTAQFSLPAGDEKNAECQPLYFVEIFDGDVRLELFRILSSAAKRGSGGETITYQCEHVLATLLDDVLFQYHTVGNLGYYTPQVLEYILNRQTTQRWRLGDIQFSHQYEYNWENENLLGALFSVPQPFTDEYMWTFDTTAYPWTLNLVQPSGREEAYIRYGVNLQGIERKVDPSQVTTRIYGLGYGEGVNQLTFADINGGKPYIDAEPEYIQRFGLVQTIFADKRFEFADTLLARCRAMLNELKVPSVQYTVDAAEIYALTKDPIDRFKVGAMVRVQDGEMGIDIKARVVKLGKSNILGQPGAVKLEIANKTQDIASSIADLRNRMHISEVYAQGATNLDTRDFADNCDPDHPAILKFYVPDDTVRINKVMLSFQTEAFRAYSKAIEGGGGVSTTTAAGGASVPSTSTTAVQTPTTTTLAATVESASTSKEWSQFATFVPDAVNVGGEHNHGIPDGTNLVTSTGENVTFSASGRHSHAITSEHKHSVTIPGHSHRVTIPGHNHTVEIPEHSHDINLPDHTHEIEYGIYEGPQPNNVSITVDGNAVQISGTSGNDINIIPYLSKDGDGRVSRGNWHEIQIAPNSLGRVVANVVTQLFVQSRGGGNY